AAGGQGRVVEGTEAGWCLRDRRPGGQQSENASECKATPIRHAVGHGLLPFRQASGCATIRLFCATVSITRRPSATHNGAMRNPGISCIIGHRGEPGDQRVLGCCARAASGHAADPAAEQRYEFAPSHRFALRSIATAYHTGWGVTLCITAKLRPPCR